MKSGNRGGQMPSRVSPWNATLSERLECFSIPEPNSGRLLWTGSVSRRGYGKVSWQGKQHQAHRMAWSATHGPISAGLFVCHKCDVPACVNVGHLFLGTSADNANDKARKGRALGALSQKDVLAIRGDTRSNAAVAKDYGVAVSTISAARSGLYYGWVETRPSSDGAHHD